MTEESSEPQSANLPVCSPDASAPSGEISRRRTLGWLFGAGGVIIAGLLSIPLIRMAFYPLFAKSGAEDWTDAGPASDYDSLHTPVRHVIRIQTTDGWQRSTSEKVVYVTKRPGGNLVVFSAVCPHLGCEISWRVKTDQFFCPCHGSVFSADGARVAGPAPRSMDSLPARVTNGRLMVRYEYFRNLLPNKVVTG